MAGEAAVVTEVAGVRRFADREVDFTIPEALLVEIAIGQSIEARCSHWPDEGLEGNAASINSHVDPTTRAVAVQARVPNPENQLRAGVLLTVVLTCRPRDARLREPALPAEVGGLLP